MLKFKIEKDDFDSLNDVEKTFYAESDGAYQLQVEGAADKTKLDEFRATNVDLLKQQEQYKGVDLEKYRELEARERQIRDKELIDKGEFDTLVAERLEATRNDYEAKLQNATGQVGEYEQKYNSLVSKYEIEGAATKAFAEHKINPEAYEAVLTQVKSKFTIDNGQVIAKDGDTILTGSDGNLTVSEFVANQPEIFKIQSSGGAGRGADSGQPMAQGKSSGEKIRAGLAARMS